MNAAEVRRLFGYDEWANARLFEAAMQVTEEQAQATMVSSFSSITATLAHIAGSEWIWLRRWLGVSPTSAPDWTNQASQESLRVQLTEVERERSAYLESITEERLLEFLDYRNLAGEAKRQRIGDLMQHVVNHSTYHRGQLVTLLRQVGVIPPATDLLIYNLENPS